MKYNEINNPFSLVFFQGNTFIVLQIKSGLKRIYSSVIGMIESKESNWQSKRKMVNTY